MGILNKFKQLFFVKFRIWKYKLLSDCENVTGIPICFHPLLLSGKGRISFGKNVQIGVVNSPLFYSHYTYLEARNKNSEIIIGDNVSINNGFTAEANSKIFIGNNILIGINCSIIDNDGHFLDLNNRTKELLDGKEVNIEENVFLGDNVTILKGVTIGRNTVIGNGSIITKSIPPNSIAAGNPAKIIGSL